MRKLLLLGVMLCLAFVSQAAPINSIINRTSCPITVTQLCYDPATCNSFKSWSITVPPGATPMPRPACPAPFETAYLVCWGAPACLGICAPIIAGQVPPPPLVCIAGFPLSAPLPPCPDCQPFNVTVTYDPINNNVIIQ